MELRRMSSISRASGIADLPSPVTVCCHDAGAASLIAAWVAAEPTREYRLCVEGPARRILAEVLPGHDSQPLPAALAGAGCLLSGSGWTTDLEHQSRLAARQHGIPALAVLDHWVNYRTRFVRDSVEALPDVFIVTDSAAAQLALETFGELRPIVTWHNRYLEVEAARVAALSARRPCTPPARLLVVLEPVRLDWVVDAAEPAEFRALDYLMENLGALTPRPEELMIRLRPHPAEARSKYQPWVARQRHARLALSARASLAEDLAWADAVAGLHSYALVVALAARRRAVSYLPPGAPSCGLRHPGVERLDQLRGERS